MNERDSIIARHKAARPDPTANPAWANAHHDMARLLEIDDKRIAELEKALADAIHDRDTAHAELVHLENAVGLVRPGP